MSLVTILTTPIPNDTDGRMEWGTQYSSTLKTFFEKKRSENEMVQYESIKKKDVWKKDHTNPPPEPKILSSTATPSVDSVCSCELKPYVANEKQKQKRRRRKGTIFQKRSQNACSLCREKRVKCQWILERNCCTRCMEKQLSHCCKRLIPAKRGPKQKKPKMTDPTTNESIGIV